MVGKTLSHYKVIEKIGLTLRLPEKVCCGKHLRGLNRGVAWIRTKNVLELGPHLEEMGKRTSLYFAFQGTSNNEGFDLWCIQERGGSHLLSRCHLLGWYHFSGGPFWARLTIR